MDSLRKFLDWWEKPLVQFFVFLMFVYFLFVDLASKSYWWVLLDAFVLVCSYRLIKKPVNK